MKDMDFEAQLRSIAAMMEYPPTPNIAASVSTRLRSSTRPRLMSKAAAWSLTVALILISSLMLIPPARAAILEFIQIGVVQIFRAEPTAVAPSEQAPSTMMPVTATPEITPEALVPILEAFAGEMTLAQAQEKVYYPILLPAFPADLGEPDRVFVQQADGEVTILVWLNPEKPDEVRMSLHFLPEGSWAIKKVQPTIISQTSVNGEYAVWTTGPYPMSFENGDLQYLRLITGHVLIWESDGITYRLETDLSLSEARAIAESLEPIP